MSTQQVKDHFGLFSRFLTLRIAVPGDFPKSRHCGPFTSQRALTQDEAQELLHQMLRPLQKKIRPELRSTDDHAVCLRIRKALYS